VPGIKIVARDRRRQKLNIDTHTKIILYTSPFGHVANITLLFVIICVDVVGKIVTIERLKYHQTFVVFIQDVPYMFFFSF
jgi:hypothetical protein